MKKENIKDSLKKNDNPMNLMALQYLLDYGRKNLLNDNFYNVLMTKVEREYEKEGSLFSKDYAMEIIKTSRKMASMEHKDLYDFIQRDLIITHEIEKENNSPDYDF